MKGVVAIVTARSGSRGLPGKNIRPLNDRPLLAYPIMAASKSKLIDRIVLSTDSAEYARIGKTYGSETPKLRPAPLAEDVPSEDVIMWEVKQLEEAGYPVSIAVTMQPTTPGVLAEDVDKCVQLVTEGAASAIAVCQTENPAWLFVMNESGVLEPSLQYMQIKGHVGIRQNLAKTYRPNGAVYATDSFALMKEKKIIIDVCKGVEMPKIRSFDIDTAEDFEIVEAIMR